MLTDTESVSIQRLDAAGNMFIALAIPWEAAGAGRFAILLGLWYLGQLVASIAEEVLHAP